MWSRSWYFHKTVQNVTSETLSNNGALSAANFSNTTQNVTSKTLCNNGALSAANFNHTIESFTNGPLCNGGALFTTNFRALFRANFGNTVTQNVTNRASGCNLGPRLTHI